MLRNEESIKLNVCVAGGRPPPPRHTKKNFRVFHSHSLMFNLDVCFWIVRFKTCNSLLLLLAHGYSETMPSIVRTASEQPNWEPFSLSSQPDPSQLDNIKAQLDLVLLALEGLTGIGSDAMLQAAKELNVADAVADRVSLWRLRQASPLRKGQGRKRLDVEEARSLVLIICHLAQGHQELIRRAVALLEQVAAEEQEPHRTALLGDYLDNFSNMYQERMDDGASAPIDTLSHLALKLLIDLFFYSSPQGVRRLWMALLDRTQINQQPADQKRSPRLQNTSSRKTQRKKHPT